MNTNKRKPTEYLSYRPTLMGKIAICVAAPAALIGIIAVLIAFVSPEAFLVTIVAEAIAVIGSILIVIDIVAFNIRQSRKQPKSKEPKELDIMRAVHMIIGIVVGIMIGYLIWH